jgi:hypothetical protein
VSRGASRANAGFPFPQHVNYAMGSIRPNHRSQAELDQDIREAYARWKTACLRSAGTDSGNPVYRALRNTDGNGNTIFEGQGHGPIITSVMAGHEQDAAAIAAGLWRYVDPHRSGIDNRLMSWNITGAGRISARVIGSTARRSRRRISRASSPHRSASPR